MAGTETGQGRELGMSSGSQPLAFSLLLVNLPRSSPINPCLLLTVHSLPVFNQRLPLARLSAHSRYRAPNRRRVLNRRRELNRRRVLRLLGSSFSIQCNSKHSRVVCTMRANLKLCLLPSKWEHVVPTDMHRGHRLRWGNSGSSASRVGAPEISFRPL